MDIVTFCAYIGKRCKKCKITLHSFLKIFRCIEGHIMYNLQLYQIHTKVHTADKTHIFLNFCLSGVGNEVSHLELLTIASAENSETGRKYVYSVQNFNALYTVVKELVQLTCEGICSINLIKITW